MSSGDNVGFIDRQTEFDVLVVGGGIIGCWTAYKAGKRGLKTLLIDQDEVGAGGSGGVLGALMPHMPERWDGKKQFQFEALHALPEEIKLLEDETSLSCGYNRCGRVAPIMNDTKRGQMAGHLPNAEKHWLGVYEWKILNKSPIDNWPIASKAEHGVVYDTLSARVNPRRILAALKQAILQDSMITLRENIGLLKYDETVCRATLSDLSEIKFSHIVLAAGTNTFGFVAPSLSVPVLALGKPIKGQAAILKADLDPTWPIMFDMGLYVIVHKDGHVAIGSTSEIEFDDPMSTDQQLETLIKRAREFCPQLKDADVMERWAGLRPRAIGRDPLIDHMPKAKNVIVATSGFKITFGVAHKMADVAIEHILDEKRTEVPESFRIPAHLAKARKQARRAEI
ncbi:FAD-dependent oxidoreductase [Lentilitoribacter sp. Alg239-R112]|uniref:NAD(P)/FAD-dependent oxidoreductase n=1 Tax=Lentilitoribacter sp. Alg239-R112 TaxID=2305987 RepID=UPI0013A6AF5C|nr:FAD-dependent oxidoreductase [Lentilitoribacter sp. Alg239-R112]